MPGKTFALGDCNVGAGRTTEGGGGALIGSQVCIRAAHRGRANTMRCYS